MYTDDTARELAAAMRDEAAAQRELAAAIRDLTSRLSAAASPDAQAATGLAPRQREAPGPAHYPDTHVGRVAQTVDEMLAMQHDHA